MVEIVDRFKQVTYMLISLMAGTTTFLLGFSAVHHFASLSVDLDLFVIYWLFAGIVILSFVAYYMTLKLLREDWVN